MAIEMLMQSYSKRKIYNFQKEIAQDMPIKVLKEYVRGTQFLGKTVARILCFLESGMKARYGVLEERTKTI